MLRWQSWCDRWKRLRCNGTRKAEPGITNNDSQRALEGIVPAGSVITHSQKEKIMWNLLGWIIFGGIAGWLASIITGRNQQQGCLMNVVVGIVGAFLGGVLYNLLTGQGLTFSEPLSVTSLTGFLVALGGAVGLLFVVNLITKRR
jgi:uncharacterized membrane protein YeaQ/YmgE (transglycosylase-associated protein family)